MNSTENMIFMLSMARRQMCQVKGWYERP